MRSSFKTSCFSSTPKGILLGLKAYRFSFNGKEKDDETYRNGNEYDYGFRVYNPRLGKFLSVDPLTKSYPWYTPYQFAGNMPISAIDLDGLEEYLAIRWYDNHNLGSTTVVKVPNSNQIAGLTGTVYVELDVNNRADIDTYKQFTKNSTPNDRIVEGRIKWDKVTNTTTGSILVGNYEDKNRSYEKDIIDLQATRGKTVLAGDDPENTTGQPQSVTISSKSPVKVFFENDKSNLDAIDKATLGPVANTLNAFPSLTATVTGNTDDNNTSSYNVTLGNNRATEVGNYLTSQGVSNSIAIGTNGEGRPSASNSTAAGKAQNRNAEVKINYPTRGH